MMLTSVVNSRVATQSTPCGTSRNEPRNVLNVNKLAKINNNRSSNNNIISKGAEGEWGRERNAGELQEEEDERVTH